jgi:hypothetical protein
VLRNPANRSRAVPLTFEQFRYGFANAVDEGEAKELYEQFATPGSGKPLFQAATSNLNPWTEAKVDTHNPERGPLLIISGEKDHTVPWAVANASYQQQEHNPGVTEIVEMKDRGHALTIDMAGARSPRPPSPLSSASPKERRKKEAHVLAEERMIVREGPATGGCSWSRGSCGC